MTEFRLNFHQTFPPSAEYILRLLEICGSNEALSKEDISERTGIPTGKSSGKVEPNICYAEYMGLLADTRNEGKHILSLTPLGEEVLQQDPGFQEKVTTAICHVRLSSPYYGASLWKVLFKDIIPLYQGEIGNNVLADELNKHFEKAVKTGPLFSAYEGMLKNLNLIRKGTQGIVLNRQKIDKELLFVYAYALLYEWNYTYHNQPEITEDEVLRLGIHSTFLLSRESFYGVLEQIAEKGIIRFNRQLSPFTLIRLHSAEDVIPLLYSELC